MIDKAGRTTIAGISRAIQTALNVAFGFHLWDSQGFESLIILSIRHDGPCDLQAAAECRASNCGEMIRACSMKRESWFRLYQRRCALPVTTCLRNNGEGHNPLQYGESIVSVRLINYQGTRQVAIGSSIIFVAKLSILANTYREDRSNESHSIGKLTVQHVKLDRVTSSWTFSSVWIYQSHEQQFRVVGQTCCHQKAGQ